MDGVVSFSFVDNPSFGMKDKEALGCSSGAQPSSFTLEQHIILRFLDDEVAQKVREIIREAPQTQSQTISSPDPSQKNEKAKIQINIEKNLRDAQLEVDGIGRLYGRIFDLPNIIESQKTINGYLFHKSSNASQILICSKDPSKLSSIDPNMTLFNHGITPPMHQVRSKHFRKPVKKSNDSYFVESEVKRLMMHDKNALSYEWEVINADEDDRNPNIVDSNAALTETEQELVIQPINIEDSTDAMMSETYMDTEMNEKNLIGDISSSSNDEYTENEEYSNNND